MDMIKEKENDNLYNDEKSFIPSVSTNSRVINKKIYYNFLDFI